MDMRALELVSLAPLMERTTGRPEITVGLLDGPVAVEHSDLAVESIHWTPGGVTDASSSSSSAARQHGTFVAGILFARRNARVPGICPGCTLVVRPIFSEMPSAAARVASTTPDELASAIVETADAGARVLNLSLALVHPTSRAQREIGEALDYAWSRGTICVVAAGNQAAVGSSVVTGHPWVIPVSACDLTGRPMNHANLGRSIGRQGLRAPGVGRSNLRSGGLLVTSTGTSIAAPFVTGAIALVWSEFPRATAADVWLAVKRAATSRRASIVPHC
jgi:subtilisin family serine protease